MKQFYHKSKELLPEILLDKETGKFQISGTSCPLNPFEFYDPIFKWFDEYLENPLQQTQLDLNLSYFNTASAKFLLKIMTKLNKLSSLDYDVKIRWFYSEDDDNMKEEGEDFKNILKVNFELISLKGKTDKTKNNNNFDDFMDDIL